MLPIKILEMGPQTRALISKRTCLAYMTSKSGWPEFPDIGATVTDSSLTITNRKRAICNKFVMSGNIACANILVVKYGKLDDPGTLMSQYK